MKAPRAVGITAKQLCTLVYICGFKPEKAKELYIDRVISPLDRFIKIQFNCNHKRVDASIFGLWSATAEYREGIGCALIPKFGAYPDFHLKKIVAWVIIRVGSNYL